jgi:xanthine/uracil permease
MLDLAGVAFGIALLVFGLVTGTDNNVLLGTLTAVVFAFLFFNDRRKSQQKEEDERDEP